MTIIIKSNNIVNNSTVESRYIVPRLQHIHCYNLDCICSASLQEPTDFGNICEIIPLAGPPLELFLGLITVGVGDAFASVVGSTMGRHKLIGETSIRQARIASG